MKAQIAMTVDVRLLVYSAFICIVMWPPYILVAMYVVADRRAIEAVLPAGGSRG